jgi:hypothetical protein
MNSLISVAQAARILDTTPYHVLQLCRTGELPSGDLEGAMVIPEAAVREYARRSTTRADVSVR